MFIKGGGGKRPNSPPPATMVTEGAEDAVADDPSEDSWVRPMEFSTAKYFPDGTDADPAQPDAEAKTLEL